jgi:hypothetical protein
MSEPSNPLELIQRGQAASRVGRREEARKYLLRAVHLTPDNVDAWMALAGVEDDPAAKTACFETVLKLDPDNIEAQLGLDMLQPEDQVQAPVDRSPDDELESVIAEASRQLDAAVGPPPPDEVPLDDGKLYCAYHPSIETMLRCNRCGKPICTRCAVQTPVGYRCKECVGRQQAVFYTGGTIDYVIGAGIALLLGGIASYLITLLGAWFFALILGPTVGIAIAEAVRVAVRRRRSKYLWLAVAGSLVASAIPALLRALMSPWALLSLGLFLVLAVGAAIARLR